MKGAKKRKTRKERTEEWNKRSDEKTHNKQTKKELETQEKREHKKKVEGGEEEGK